MKRQGHQERQRRRESSQPSELANIHPCPIARLPPDILLLIFQIIHAKRVSGFKYNLRSNRALELPLSNVSAVCRDWRDFTISNPSLWKNIMLGMYSKSVPNFSQMLDLYLSRSHDSPLSIYFQAIQVNYGNHDTQNASIHYEKVLVALSRHAPRIRKFCMLYTSLGHMVDLSILQHFDGQTLQSLETLQLYIHGCVPDDSPSLVGQSMRCFSSVRLRSVLLDFTAFDIKLTALELPWNGLEHLYIKIGSGSLHQIVEVLTTLRTLSLCVTDEIVQRPSHHPASTAVLNNLEELTIISGSDIRSFMNFVNFPRLQRLRLVMRPVRRRDHSPMDYMEYVPPVFSKVGLVKLCSTPSLEHMTLERVPITVKNLLQCFSLTPNLTHLALCSFDKNVVYSTNTLLKGLLWSHNDPSQRVLPKLRPFTAFGFSRLVFFQESGQYAGVPSCSTSKPFFLRVKFIWIYEPPAC